MRIEMPTTVQIRQLPELLRVRVPPEWEDLNGHVNIKHHLGMYDMTTNPMLGLLGISEEWVRRERIGIMDLEHHIWYQRELHVGDEVALHLRFTGRGAKLTTGLVFLVNAARDEVASAIEFMSLAVDLAGRRAVPFPSPIKERIDALMAGSEALGWAAPRSGVITL